MLLPLKRIIDEDRISKKDGMCYVYIQYCHTTKKRTLLNTEIRIPPAFWDSNRCYVKKNLPENIGNHIDLNQEIDRMYQVAEAIVTFINKNKVPNPTSFAKAIFTPTFKAESLEDFEPENVDIASTKSYEIYYQIDNYIKAKTPFVTKDMLRIYQNMKDHLQGYEAYRKTLPEYADKPLTFATLDLNFYEGLVHFLTYVWVNQKCSKKKIVGLKVNTIGKTIKQLRTFLRDRIRKNIIPSIDMSGWKILEEEVDAIYLTEKEINKISKKSLAAYPELEEDKDDIILGCLTGLRFSDFSKIEKYDMRDDFLYIKQQKSRHWVVVPLRPAAKEILQRRFARNDYSPNSNHEFNKHGRTILKITGISDIFKHSYKKGNKMIVEAKPKYQWFSSHTCRRSFCTNEFLAGTPVALIMKISGHKSEKDFYKYIRITPEESARILKRIWEDRANGIIHKNVPSLSVNMLG